MWLRTKSLTFRLTGTLIVALTLLLSITGVVQISLQKSYAEKCATINGLALTEVIYGALQSSMLSQSGHAELQNSVVQIAKQAPNLDVRIYNKKGVIAVASFPPKLGTKLDTKKPAICGRCHNVDIPPVTLPQKERVHAYTEASKRYLAIIKPIPNQKSCSNGVCHAHTTKERLLGLLHVTVALDPSRRSQQYTTILMVVATTAGILLVMFVVLMVVRRAVRRPIENLRESVAKLGEGNYSVRYEQDSIEEFDELGDAFNRMARDLERANMELMEWNQTLERRVEKKTAALQQAQEQMIRIERMASLGKLSAVVAHEINNPLASVVTYSKLLSKRIKKHALLDDWKDAPEILDAISSEAARCGDIVTNLLLFARRTGSKQEPTNANEAISKALFLIKHKMDLASVDAVCDLQPDLPTVVCDPGQLQQALLALLVNAVEAMPDGGQLRISSRAEDDKIVLIIDDSGMGMTDDVRDHIFEPFFTTKSDGDGKGLGLGLSVVYGIVQRNHGTITVDSDPNEGTTFTLSFPLTDNAPGPIEFEGEEIAVQGIKFKKQEQG
jgi:two-component system NtrC family sensor kinase